MPGMFAARPPALVMARPAAAAGSAPGRSCRGLLRRPAAVAGADAHARAGGAAVDRSGHGCSYAIAGQAPQHGVSTLRRHPRARYQPWLVVVEKSGRGAGHRRNRVRSQISQSTVETGRPGSPTAGHQEATEARRCRRCTRGPSSPPRQLRIPSHGLPAYLACARALSP